MAVNKQHGRQEKMNSGVLILIDYAVCRQLTRAECWHTQPHRKGLSLILNQNHSWKFPLFIKRDPWELQEAVPWWWLWAGGSPVQELETSKHLYLCTWGRMSACRERTSRWSPAWWSRIFCLYYQAFPLPPSTLSLMSSETLYLQLLWASSHWIYFVTCSVLLLL